LKKSSRCELARGVQWRFAMISRCPGSASWPALFCALFLLVIACAPSPPELPSRSGVHAADDREHALRALEQLAGPLTLRVHPALGTVASIELATPLRITYSQTISISTAARDVVLRHRPLFGLGPADLLETRDSVGDSLGRRRVTYTQKRFGVSVWGSQLDVHLRIISSVSAEVVRLHGHLQPLDERWAANSLPTLSTEAARQRALGTARELMPRAALSAYSPSLYYLDDEGRLQLVYRVEVYGQNDSLPVRGAYFIDAHDSRLRSVEDLVARIDMTVPAQGSGKGALGVAYKLAVSQRGDTFSLQDPTRGGQRTTAVEPLEKLPGQTVSSERADSWDDHLVAPGHAVDVHAHLATLWDYFAKHHGHFGWDGQGHGLAGIVHLGERTNLALFDGDRLMFGDGDGRDFAPLGAALDIVAHEYVHAVIRKHANLATSGQSGQLDEGLANLMACLIEKTTRPMTGNWTLGEEIYHPGGQPGALKNLASAHDPTSVSSRLGHAGYLLAQRIGIERTAAIVFRAITVYLFRYAEIADAADALLSASRDLYDAATTSAVRESLGGVGL
jgi:bacillolysin